MKYKEKSKLVTLADWKGELDRVFSLYIRIRDDGKCFTCGNEKSWKHQQNGHYISRSYLSLRFDEINCNCQCVGCNIFRHGNMDEYAVALTRKHGNGILIKLHNKKYEIVKFDIPKYKKLVKKYERKIKKLLE